MSSAAPLQTPATSNDDDDDLRSTTSSVAQSDNNVSNLNWWREHAAVLLANITNVQSLPNGGQHAMIGMFQLLHVIGLHLIQECTIWRQNCIVHNAHVPLIFVYCVYIYYVDGTCSLNHNNKVTMIMHHII